MLLRITNGFERLSDADLLSRANSIILGVSGNPVFVTPVPSIATMQAAADEFRKAMAKSLAGSSLQKAFKNEKRSILINRLHSLSNYVLFIADGDALVAQSSNFSITKPASPAPSLIPPSNQKLQDGQNRGELTFSFPRVIGAKSYIYQYTTDPENESLWQTQTGTVRKVTFKGPDEGKRYWCRVLAIGTKNKGVYSSPVSRIVQ